MKLLFIQSLVSGDIRNFRILMLVVVIFWVAVVLAIVIDLACGVYKAKQNNELISSDGYKRTVSKFVLYFSALGIALLADWGICYVITSFHSFIPNIPYLTIIFSLYIIVAVEFRSVLEKADAKKRKQLSSDVKNIIELLSKIKDKEVLDYIKKLVEKEKKNEKATV